MQNLFCVIISPPITVCSIDVYTKIQQELDYVVMSCTHCIVQGCDALIIGSARILHLEKTRLRFKKKERKKEYQGLSYMQIKYKFIDIHYILRR